MHIFKENWKVSLSAAPLGMALLAVFIVSCGSQDAAREPTEVPKPAPTATARDENTEASQPENTPTPYSQTAPPPVVVTATAIQTATAAAAPTTVAGLVAPPARATSTPVLVSTPEAVATSPPTPTAAPDVPTPTAEPVVATTPDPAAAPTSSPAQPALAEPPGGWPTPQEIGAIELGKFIDRGYFFKSISEGETIPVYLGPNETREVTCGPEIGTAFDRSNPTWSDASHWIWVWRKKERYSPGCRGMSKYEDWVNKSVPAKPPVLRDGASDHLIAEWGEPLKFATDDSINDYSLHIREWGETFPPVKVIQGSGVWGADSWEGAVIWKATLEDGWVANCGHRSFPWAIWKVATGFYTISIEDEEAAYREEWTDEDIAMKEEARARGWYFIYRSDLQKSFCWRVPNHEEIPPHRPCLECQWRSHG